jgi:hypothetical protein
MDESRKKINEIIDDAGGDFSGGGGGGGLTPIWITRETLFSITNASSDSDNNSLVTYSIPGTVPATAAGIIVSCFVQADEAKLELSLKSSSVAERMVAKAYGPNNSDDAASDFNTFLIPYTSTIQAKLYAYGFNPGNADDIGAMYVEGYVTSSGGGSATTTFDDDAPTSPSQGDTWWDNGEGKMYIYSGSVWVQTNATGGGSARGGGSYDTGWSTHGGTVADGAALTINHNLGTSDILVQVYLADDASGTNNLMLNNQTDGAGAYLYDYQAQSASSSSIIIQLNGSGYTRAPSSGTIALHYNYTSKYVRVIIHAGGNPIQYSSGWIDTDGTTAVDDAATLTITHNLGTTDIVTSVFVNGSASDSGAHQLHDGVFTGGISGGGADSNMEGWFISGITDNAITLQLGSNGYYTMTSSGTMSDTDSSQCTSFSGLFLKVVIMASVSGEPIAQMAKATIAFDGTSGSIGTGAKSHNVSSVTDNGTGNWTVNFTNSISNPIVIAFCKYNLGNENLNLYSFSSTTAQVTYQQDSGGAGHPSYTRDSAYVCMAVY